MAAATKTKPAGPKDSLREIVETIVFVIALVLMLKLFVVEAFVIPTGSMAETLFGYQKNITCVECGHIFPVNSSEEAEPADGRFHLIDGATCPNCRKRQDWKPKENGYDSGDRVLVHKAIYSLGFGPTRGDVVVFKYPVDPQVNHTAQNYIKRLWGLGDETLAIFQGNLYRSADVTYPADELNTFGRPKFPRPEPGSEDRLWEGPMVDSHSRTTPPYRSAGIDFTYHNCDRAIDAFKANRADGFQRSEGKASFRMLQKTDAQILAMRRIVYDNEHQSKTLAGKGVPPRWTGDTGWKADKDAAPKVFTHSGAAPGRLGYSHRVSGPPTPALLPNGEQLRDPGGFAVFVDDWRKVETGYSEGLFPPGAITNFLGYNTAEEAGNRRRTTGDFTVPDLMLECRAKLDADAELTLELTQETTRTQVVLTPGTVTFKIDDRIMGTMPVDLTAGREVDLRFSNFDGELRLWINGRRVKTDSFSPSFTPVEVGAFNPKNPAPTSIVVSNGATVSNLKLWQDTYFTPAANDGVNYNSIGLTLDTFYVQPGHFLCLGDNSGQSSDSRKWGLVPERLMLGQAQFIFFPFGRMGFIK